MKFGFIGCGNMASAIINGGLKKGIFTKEELLASVKNRSFCQEDPGYPGISCSTDNLGSSRPGGLSFSGCKASVLRGSSRSDQPEQERGTDPGIYRCRKNSGMAERKIRSGSEDHPDHA